MALLTITLTGEYERLEPYVQALRYALDVREEQTEVGEAGIVRKTLTVESYCSRVNNVTISIEEVQNERV
jgi:hypothetical protein